MRSPLLLLALLLVSPIGCISARPGRPVPSTRPPRSELLAHAAREFAASGSPLAEEILGTGGEDAVAWLRTLRDEAEGERRLQAQSLLLSSGEDLALTPAEEVEILLFDLTRSERYPFAAVRALARLRELGPAARPALRTAAQGTGARAEAARRLLREGPETAR